MTGMVSVTMEGIRGAQSTGSYGYNHDDCVREYEDTHGGRRRRERNNGKEG